MTTIRPLCLAAGMIVAIMGLATPAAAQTNDETFQNLTWNFSTPGARANGMGRTFIGQADDATAAVTNPAGLMSLTRPQVYAEFKHTKLEAERLAAADSLITRQPTTTSSTVNSLSFASFSAPLGSRVAVGFSVHRFLDYEEEFKFAPRALPDPSIPAFYPVDGTVDFVGSATYGGSVAVMVTSGLRVGVTVATNRLDADTFVTRTNYTGVARTPTNTVVNQLVIHDAQTATSFTVGGLYRVKSDKLAFGFTYTKSPRFVTDMDGRGNPGLDDEINEPLVQFDDFPKAVELNVPDHFGIGVAVRPTSRLLIAFDVVRAKYSSLTENTTVIFPGDVLLLSTDYETPDVTEVHLGAELMLGNLMGKPFFLRGGVFTNPNHLTSYTGKDISEQAYFNQLPRKDDTRGTLGAGLVIGSRTQIDVAYVWGREFVASTAVRF